MKCSERVARVGAFQPESTREEEVELFRDEKEVMNPGGEGVEGACYVTPELSYKEGGMKAGQ